jgi:hypothetical protein
MDLEKLTNQIHPDSSEKRSGVQTLFWYVAAIPFFLFSFTSGFALFIFFVVEDNKSYTISNLGFAILLGLASLCFSYCKLLDNGRYKRIHHDVQKTGEYFLISAIAFIISSALKYSWTLLSPMAWLRRNALNVIFGYTFLFAEIACVYGLAKLVDVLYIRMTNSNN